MELSTRNGFGSKADVEEKSFGIQMSYSYSTKFISWITFPKWAAILVAAIAFYSLFPRDLQLVIIRGFLAYRLAG